MKSLLQTKEWADFRVSQGWQAYEIDGISILERKLPMGKSFLYAPEVEWDQLQKLQNIDTKIQKIAQEKRAIFFRLEILDEYSEKIVQKLKDNGFIKAFEELQPEWRQVIDISKSEEEILAQMKEKGRYNIKIAQKNGIIIKKADLSTSLDNTRDKSLEVNEFYEIFSETAKRDGFSIRPREYFEKMLEILGENIELLIAEYQGKIIAAEIVSYYKETASYLYGASSSEFRNVMAPYLLHWEVIKLAKARGSKFYDLLAVDPIADSSQQTASSHKYAGIGRFKRQFGGRTVHITGSYDLVYKPVWYWLFRMAEKMRRR